MADVPDYLNDLNAMHMAEKTLMGEGLEDNSWSEWNQYNAILGTIVGLDNTFHTTASQRAEAFLRTIGKWVDSDTDTESLNASANQK